VKDSSGNAAGALTRTVNVTQAPDTTAPVITLKGDAEMEVSVGDTFVDPGVLAGDDRDGDISAKVVVGGDTVDTSTKGEYVLTYNVADAAGNAAAEVTRKVIVKDTDGPVITLTGAATIQLEVKSETYTELGATATDSTDGALTVNVTGTVDTNTVGTYEITYAATDSDGNETQVIRTVHVVDTVPPRLLSWT